MVDRIQGRRRDVLVVPGEFFFFGLDEPWGHRDECIRITYSQQADAVQQGIRIVGETIRDAHRA
jgi:valine--pyruvate aminotransferase